MSMPSQKWSWVTTPGRTFMDHHAPCPPPHGASRPRKQIARTKKKRKKAAALAVPVAASDNVLTATLTPSTAPAMKKGKTTNKKKATEPIDLCTMLMWAKMTNGASHHVVAIAHGQKWVVGNAATINGDSANEPLSGRQWYQKGLSGKRIAPGNPNFADMLVIEASQNRKRLVLNLNDTQ